MSAGRLGWWARKGIRGGFGRATFATGLVAARALASAPQVRAITYHRFGDVPRDPWVVRSEDFDSQMQWLAGQGLAVSLADVLAFVEGREQLPNRAVLVTIDDGCLSTLSVALPILKRYAIPAAAFVSAGLVGSTTVSEDHGERYLSWDELRDLHQEGVEIGSHAFDHRSLGRMSPDAARDQASRSRSVLEDRLGAPVCSFAYPFGTRSDFNEQTDQLLSDSGYSIAFNSLHGAIATGMSPISLPRVKIEAGEGMTLFRLSCRGAMDPWRLVDEAIGRLRGERSETTA